MAAIVLSTSAYPTTYYGTPDKTIIARGQKVVRERKKVKREEEKNWYEEKKSGTRRRKKYFEKKKWYEKKKSGLFKNNPYTYKVNGENDGYSKSEPNMLTPEVCLSNSISDWLIT